MNLLTRKKTSLARLKKRLFGARTETTEAVLGSAAEGATSPPAAEGGQSATSSSPASEAPPKRRQAHGRNGAGDYRGVQRIPLVHESLQPGDNCLECQDGTVYALTLTQSQLAAADAWHARQAIAAARQELPKSLSLATPPAPVEPDGDLKEWQPEQFVALGNRGAFAVSADGTAAKARRKPCEADLARSAGGCGLLATTSFCCTETFAKPAGWRSRNSPRTTAPSHQTMRSQIATTCFKLTTGDLRPSE